MDRGSIIASSEQLRYPRSLTGRQREQQWAGEVGRAVAASGLPWRVSLCRCAPAFSRGWAELVHRRSGRWCQIVLPLREFSTPAGRVAEISRQLHVLHARMRRRSRTSIGHPN